MGGGHLNCIDAYDVLHVCFIHYEHLLQSDDCLYLKLTPIGIYELMHMRPKN